MPDTKPTLAADNDMAILFPDRIVIVRYGRHLKRPVPLRVRPLTMRQLMELRHGVAHPMELATGKPLRWLRKLLPDDFASLQKLIEQMNDWTPEKLEAQLGKDDKQRPITIARCVALLAASGHGPTAWLDYTPPQLGLHVREALAVRSRSDGLNAALSAEGTLRAIAAAFSEDGGRALKEFVRNLLKE